MTDTYHEYDQDHVIYSDPIEIDLASPALSISSATDAPSRQIPTNQVQTARPISDAQPSKLVYGAELPLEASSISISPYEASVQPNSGRHAATVLQLSDDSNIEEQRTIQIPTLASFGSQSWTPSAGPYLDFAPQPTYEPTGELRHETIESFDQFNQHSGSKRSESISNENNLKGINSQGLPPPSLTANTSDPVITFTQPIVPRSALKRKASSLTNSPVDSLAPKRPQFNGNNPVKTRTVSFDRMSRVSLSSADEDSTSSDLPQVQHSVQTTGTSNNHRQFTRQSTDPAARTAANVQTTSTQGSSQFNRGSRDPSGHVPRILPPEKVFPIQIGSELFRLSGASISSDAPSYFTQFFEDQIRQNEETGGVRTLYIDRDPVTFRDVARHLQGYYVKPLDGSHFVKLFADAQFYSLPRLIDQLFDSEIFIQIGDKNFQIPKDIFSEPGNSPNFFSLGFAVFFSTPGEVFPGLDRRGLLRPPSITPPCVPGRSAETFTELLHLLRGYPLHIKNEAHRNDLLRDCRYFHLRGLEQKLIAHEISYNLRREKHEICIRLEDVKPSGVLYRPDDTDSDQITSKGWVYYSRPFVDDSPHEVVIEIGGECTTLDLNDMRVDFHNLTKARISSLFQVVANKMNLPSNAPLGLMMLSGGRTSQSASPGHTPLSEDRVKARFDEASDITLDGKPFDIDWDSPQGKHVAHGPAVVPDDSDPDTDSTSKNTSSESPAKQQPPVTTAAGRSISARQTKSAQVESSSKQRAMRSSSSISATQGGGLTESEPSPKKRKRLSSPAPFGEWTIRTGQWRLRVQPSPQDGARNGCEIVLIAVKIDAFSTEKARNAQRRFLT